VRTIGTARSIPRRGLAVVAALAAFAGGSVARAQEMEPRAYSPAPVGTNFFAVIAGDTRGGVLFDPTIPITDASAGLRLVTLGYGRTFALGSRQGLVVVAVPCAWGHAEGVVQEEAASVRRAGFGDARLKASVNVLGPRAMSVREFKSAPRKTILGVSVAVQAPVGEYDGTKLINLGTNRLAVKPEIGVSVPVGGWYLDAYAGAWFFATNDDFYPGGATRRQDPLTVLQTHGSYSFKSRAWVAFDATWYGGGDATVDSGPPSTRQSSSRVGATASFPLTGRQSLKLAFSTGATTRTGTEFDTFLVAWQVTWFDRPRDGRP
jgi:hypothetical protein